MTATVESNKDQTFQQQFDELYRENRQMLYRAAYRITGHHQDAEDVVQSVFTDLMLRPRPDNYVKNPIGFVHGAIVNKALKAFSKQMRQKRTHVSDGECDQISAAENMPEVDERIAHLRVALAKMNPKLVKTLNLCCVEGLRCRDAAKILRRPLGTVLSDLFRAKFQVRRLLRTQEKHDEAQKNQRPGIPTADLAGPSAARG